MQRRHFYRTFYILEYAVSRIMQIYCYKNITHYHFDKQKISGQKVVYEIYS